MTNEIYCSLDAKCKNPVGPIREGQSVTFSIRVDKMTIVQDPKLIIFRIDKWEDRKEIDLRLSRASLNSNYYSCTFVPAEPDVYFYYFSVKLNSKYVEIRRDRFSKSCFGGSENECFQLTVYSNNICVPSFLKGATFYQIFPDRFYNSGTKKENVPLDRKIHENWNDTPDYLPDENGRIRNNDYFGGDLRGVTEKLDYIASLGVTIIYFNPIFEAHANHRYNTADYLKIDPLLGTEEDFRIMCQEAKKRGIRVILDGVFNHTGSDSIYFNREGRYEGPGAYQSKESPFYPWYSFIEYPDKYEAWWGHESLPKLRRDNDVIIDFFCKVIRKWIGLGASGFRFDVVDELTNYMLRRLSREIKEMKLDDGETPAIIGEVWEDVSTKEAYGERKHYFTHNTLDSAMNYVYKDALFEFFEKKDAESLLDAILRTIENYPKDCLDAMMNIISGHDIERAITRLAKGRAGGNDRYWQANNDYLDEASYEFGKKRLKQMAVLQYFLNGNPCLYYGDEAGVYGFTDPHNRKTYPWGREDNNLIQFYMELGRIRSKNHFLKDALFTPIFFHNSLVIFKRNNPAGTKSIYVGVNLSTTAFDIRSINKNGQILLTSNKETDMLEPDGYIVMT